MTNKNNDFEMNQALTTFVQSLNQLGLDFNTVERHHENQLIRAEFAAVPVAKDFLRMLSKAARANYKNCKGDPALRTPWEQFGNRLMGLGDDGWSFDLAPRDDEAESLQGKRLAKGLRKLPKLKTFSLCVTFPEMDLFFANECLAEFIDEDDEDEAGPDEEEEGEVEDDEDEDEDDDEEALVGYESGRGSGRWWAEQKADQDQLARLAEFQAAMEAQTYGDFDPFIDGTSAYGPEELTYFAIEPDDVKDRTASQWFWRFFFNNDDAGPYGNASFVKGFIAGALEPAPVGR